MGLIYASIQLSNPVQPTLKDIQTKCLVETGTLFLCIPEHIAIQLQLQEFDKREVTVASVHKQLCPYVGPIKVAFENRMCLTGALVLGNSVLLGAIPIEDMDLVIHPAKLTLTVNPENPNIPGTFVKSANI